MNITSLQLLLIIVFSMIIGVALIKIFSMYKNDNKIDDKEKSAINIIIINVIKNGLQLSVIKNRNELKLFCVERVYQQLQELKINDFSKADIEVAVDLVLNGMDGEITKRFGK